VAVMHDLSNARARDKLDPRIRALLEKFPDKNTILVLNKVDTIKSKATLLETVRILTAGIVAGSVIKVKKSHLERVREQEKYLEMDNVIQRAKVRAKLDTSYDLSVDDKIKKAVLSAFTEEEIRDKLHLVGWPKFKDVFMISALNGDGIGLVKEYFVRNAKEASWMFEEDFLTDVETRELTLRVVKSALLDMLPQEIPYKITPKIDYWDETDSGELRIVITLKCPNGRYVGRVSGAGGVVLKKITAYCESSLTGLLRMPVDLCINPFSDNDPKKKSEKVL